MRMVNMHEAKTHLSKLVEAAAGGEPFVIAKAGKPMVKVVPLEVEAPKAPQRLGFMKGQFKVPADFDTMYAEEIRRMFEGELDDEDAASPDAPQGEASREAEAAKPSAEDAER